MKVGQLLERLQSFDLDMTVVFVDKTGDSEPLACELGNTILILENSDGSEFLGLTGAESEEYRN